MPVDLVAQQNRRTQVWQLVFLILLFPLQYLLTSSTTESNRIFLINRFVSNVKQYRQKWSDLMVWCQNYIHETLATRLLSLSSKKKQSVSSTKSARDEDNPPKEVQELDADKDGDFATSREPRIPRPPEVLYRVGQVLKHKKWGYRGVIIGWDAQAKAPEKWLNHMHKENKEWRKGPNYAVLVDTRDRLTPQVAYVIQENIQIVSNVRIMHPLLDHYFENYDGAQYLCRPWLRKVYPVD